MSTQPSTTPTTDAVESSASGSRRWFLIAGLFVTLAAALGHAVSPRFTDYWYEDDLEWMVPLTAQMTANPDDADTWGFVFHMQDEWGVPSLNASLLLFQRTLGLDSGAYNAVLFGLHLVNTVLLFLLVQNGLRRDVRVAGLAASAFLIYHPHWHAYSWPVAVQHLLVLLHALAFLNCYLVAIDPTRRTRWAYPLALAVAFTAGFARISILLLPVAILFHHVWQATSTGRSAYRRWLPFYAMFLVYFPFELAYGGTGGILLGEFVPRLSTSSPVATGFVIQGLGVIGLISVGIGLHLFGRLSPVVRRRTVAALIVVGLVGLVAWQGRNVAYFAWPVVEATHLLLWPGEALDGTVVFSRWHLMGVSPFDPVAWLLVPVSLGIWAMFAIAVRRDDRLVPFLGWTLAVIPYLAHAGIKAQSFHLPSRYFYYVSPVVCIAFAIAAQSAGRWLSNRFPGRMEWCPAHARSAGWVAGVLLLACLQLPCTARNVRGTTFPSDHVWSYGFIKWSHGIERSIGESKSTPPAHVAVLGMPFHAPDHPEHTHRGWDFDGHHPFRYVLGRTMGAAPNAVPRVTLKDDPADANAAARFTIENFDLCDATGRRVDPFARHYHATIDALNRGMTDEARRQLAECLEHRPFLFERQADYASLETVVALSGAETYLAHLERLPFRHSLHESRHRYNVRMMQEETRRYARALVLNDYLAARPPAGLPNPRLLADQRTLADDDFWAEIEDGTFVRDLAAFVEGRAVDNLAAPRIASGRRSREHEERTRS